MQKNVYLCFINYEKAFRRKQRTLNMISIHLYDSKCLTKRFKYITPVLMVILWLFEINLVVKTTLNTT